MSLLEESPFYANLSSNYVPSDEEHQSIQEYLEIPEKTLAEIDTQISQHEAILRQLHDQRQQLHTIIEPHRALISPFRRIPNDILGEIFVNCLPHKHNSTMSPYDAPVLLTHICSRWRQVALNTPRLWSSLHLYSYVKVPYLEDEAPPEGVLTARDSRVAQWMMTAGKMPLSLSFGFQDSTVYGSASNTEDIGRLYHLLSTTYDRWDELDMVWRMCYTNEVLPVFSAPHSHPTAAEPNAFHRVRKLRLRLYLHNTSIPNLHCSPEAASSLFDSLSLTQNKRLRHLNLCINLPSYLPAHAPFSITQLIPCAQLEVLDLQDTLDAFYRPTYILSQDAILAILRQCTNLVVFKVNVATGPKAIKDQPEAVMSRLKHLSMSLNNLSFQQHEDFLRCCVCPALTSFHLRSRPNFHDIEGFGISPSLLSPFVDQFSRTLTSLTVDFSYHVSTLLPQLPSLVQLHLESGIPEDLNSSDASYFRSEIVEDSSIEVIELLTPSDDGSIPHCCPNLRYLKWDGNTPFSDTALINFLMKKATSPHSSTPLKQVHILFSRARERDIFRECRELVRAGLDLRLEYPEYLKVSPTQRLNAKLGLPVHKDVFALGWD